jgi:hypothetical protein
MLSLGYSPVDIAEVRTEEGTLYLFVATDHACTSADAERHEQANKIVAAQFLRHVMAAIPAKIHTVGARRGIVETVDAFANAQGGTVLVT